MATPRAFLRVGGATLARHQLMLALAAGSERIVCFARALDPEMIELQHAAEAAGARFHMVAGGRGLAALVTTADEVLVLAEGLIPPRGEVPALLLKPVVLVQPADSAIQSGFERIDIDHASAGMMLVPGHLIERLNHLPDDADPASALLRIALQGGVAQRLVPEAMRTSGHWLLVRDESEAHAAELDWVEQQTRGQGYSPGLFVAAWFARRFGPSLLHAGSGSTAFTFSAVALAGFAGFAGWFGQYALALGLCGLAWVSQRSGAMLEQIRAAASGGASALLARRQPFGIVLDAIIAALATLATTPYGGEPLWHRAFPALALLGLIQLVPRIGKGRWRSWLCDRLLACLLLGGLAQFDLMLWAVPGLVIALLATAILVPARFTGLTRV